MLPRDINNVAVVGAGMMGHAIAQEFAQNGYAVKYSFGRRFGVAGPFEIYEHNDGYDLTLQCEKYMLSDMHTSQQHYELLLEKVARGELGAKSGSGFYDWNASFTKKWRARMFQNLVELRRGDLGKREDNG